MTGRPSESGMENDFEFLENESSSPFSVILLSLIISLLMIMIVVGNILVVIAIQTESSLKTIQNWFIASLAFSDLFIGLLIMPFSLSNELLGYWIFGSLTCDIYGALDVLLCTASILNICLIAIDRYWSITQAINYITFRTKFRVGCLLVTVWILSGLISLPPLLGWKKDENTNWLQYLLTEQGNQSTRDFMESLNSSGRLSASNFTFTLELLKHPQCQLSQDLGYIMYSSFGSFYIPSCIMVFVYIKIYFAARDRARRNIPSSLHQDRKNQKNCKTQTQTRNKSEGKKKTLLVSRRQEKLEGKENLEFGNEKTSFEENKQNGDSTCISSQYSCLTEHKNSSPSSNETPLHLISDFSDPLLLPSKKPSSSGTLSALQTSQKESERERKKRIARKKERRATLILGLIMGSFIACWFPFFFLYSLSPLCPICEKSSSGCCVFGWGFSFAFWLGYSNSALNPVIYTVFNKDFRRAFKRILFK